MKEYVIAAFVFGLTGGFKPGPLGIVVIQQTLAHGLRHGLKACLAPIVTDGPIIVAAFLVLARFGDKTPFIGMLSLIGGLYLLWLASKIIGTREMEISAELSRPRSLETAIKVNFLSPNPYLFWFTAGGTYLALGTGTQSAAFITVSIGTLVVSKMITAGVAAYCRELLDSNAYVWVMRFLGLLLAGFGVLFIARSQNVLFG